MLCTCHSNAYNLAIFILFFKFLLFCLCLELVLVGVLHQHSAIRLVLLGSKVDVVLDIENGALRIILGRLEIQHQVILDSAGGIGLEVGVVAGVQLSGNTKVVIVSDHDVDVSRAVRMTAHDAEKLGRGTRCVDGVLGRLEAVEPELAVLVGAELAAEVVARLVLGVVGVVFAVGAGLPHVEDGVGDTLACINITDDTVEECELTILGHILDDAGAVVAEGGFGRPEGSEDARGCGSLSSVGNDLVVDLVDERLNTENIADTPCLVAVLLVGLAKRVDVVDTNDPLLLLELNVSAEVVHVADKGCEDLALSRLGLGAHEANDMVGKVGVEL
jgi:hypothetical protein